MLFLCQVVILRSRVLCEVLGVSRCHFSLHALVIAFSVFWDIIFLFYVELEYFPRDRSFRLVAESEGPPS